jgi:hypothetical protein
MKHRYCEICGEEIFEGEAVRYEYPKGNVREDVDGNYYRGAGVCEICQKELCADCAGFDGDGVCKDCRKDEEEICVF